MTRTGIPDTDRDAFLSWAVRQMWDQYKADRMNKRIVIENEIRAAGIRLPNGTINKEYSTSFSLPMASIADVRLEGAGELGLTFDITPEGTCTLAGRPSVAGDYTLRLRFTTVEGEPESELPLPIAFNPDPRSLWRDIPTDPDIPYFKPDAAAEYVKVEAGADGFPRKDMVAASRRGRSHAQEGRPRDDHFALFHCDRSDWYIMAVADGAGSAKFSRKGAEVACTKAVEHCRALLQDNPEFEQAIRNYEADRDDADKRSALTRHVFDIVYRGAIRAHEAVKNACEANSEARLRDFATTLMFAVCKRFDFGWFIASFWVGDGAMCIFDQNAGTAKLLGTPDEGEFSGQTRFLTMPEIFHDREAVGKRLRMAIVPDFTALFLMSDGVSDPMFETDRNLNDYTKWDDFYRTLLEGFPKDDIPGVDLMDDNPKAADELLRWLDFWSPGNHDDRTIAILY